MASSLSKATTLATKPKRAAPKAKYIDPIVQATFSEDGGLQDIVKTLSVRLRDENSTVVFKSLIVLHSLLRSGSLEPTFSYLSSSSISKSLQNLPQQNLSAYASYLESRLKSYSNLKRDLIRDKSDRRSPNRLRSLGVEKGLLREVRECQRQIAALVESKFYQDDIDDDVSMTALRLLTKDLLVLFQAVNEGAMNVLEHYFEMSHPDASTALKIYKTFCRDTEKVVSYLATAKKMHNVLNVQIPNLRHAPISLVGSLEEYLNDPNFEKNREEYKENKRIADGGTPKAASTASKAAATSSSSETKPTATPSSSTAPATSFTDFFESIEQAQTPMFNPATGSPFQPQFQPQQTGFNPFLSAQPTGMMGMPNPFMMPQQTGFMMPQQTGYMMPQQTGMMANPFRQSMMMTGAPGGNSFQQQQQQQPFAPQQTGSPFGQQPQQTGSPFGQQLQPLQSQPTGAFAAFGGLAQQPQQPSPFAQPQHQQSMPTGAFAQSQPASSSPFGQPTSSSPFAPTRSASTPFSQPAQPATNAFAPPQRQQTSPTPAPLTPQKTGARNPFAPAPGEVVPVKQPSGPSMNMMAMNAFNQQQQQQNQQQQQQQNGNGSMFGNGNAFGGAANGNGSTDQQQPPQPLQPVKTGLLGNIASEFAMNRTSSPSPMGSTPAPATSLSTPFSSLSMSSAPPFSSASSFATSTPFSSSFATSTSPAPTTPSELRPQPTGFGGSTMKPFQPTSSFGSKLADEMGPSPPPFVSSQSTGQQPLLYQPTGTSVPAFNPFRASTLPSSTGMGTGSSFLQSQPTGAFGQFGQQQQTQNGMQTGSLI